MDREKIYDLMEECQGRRTKVVLTDGEELVGIPRYFESRLDNEDDEGDWAGKATMVIDADVDDDSALLVETEIESIEILE